MVKEGDSDERSKRHAKVVDSMSISHEKGSRSFFLKFSRATVEAVNYTRTLANKRATEADPAYMEREIHRLV